MSIYTKKGDKGETGLPGKRRVAKSNQLFEVLGAFDQTSATIGVAIAQMNPTDDASLIEELEQIQSNFLSIGACLAAEKPEDAPILETLAQETRILEQRIDEWDALLPELKNFILVGGTPAGAALHLARTFARQAERHFHRLPEPQIIEPISIYLNRLSDYFFQAARYYNFCQKQSEKTWRSRQN